MRHHQSHRQHGWTTVLAATCGLIVTTAVLAWFRGGTNPEPPSPLLPEGNVRLVSLQTIIPDLSGGVAWINSAQPITMEDLKGKIVLLDFWTYCCINCHHVLPDLEKLEEKYPNELVVIGVHSPKFEAERDTENIRQKVREYQIKHPVVNDANMTIWRRFRVNAWPTLAIVDANGNYRGALPGEGHYDRLDAFIGMLAEDHREKGELNETPFVVYAESDRPSDGPLLYPGKVLADEANDRLFIADTSHHRIVVTDLEGNGKYVIGSGELGFDDGAFASATFNRLQGLCLVDDNTLYVADTENHALRKVDLQAKRVTTVAGTGEQAPFRSQGGPGNSSPLNSPWDVLPIPETSKLAIAMAGPHQIWTYDLEDGNVAVWAGSGREDIIDGSYSSAALAQPSGLATDGQYLYVADSEVSGIRAVALDETNEPQVRTIVGLGLFEFGDVDGQGAEVRLQHCLGLAYGHNTLFIADTYNDKIKACNPSEKTVETFVGTGESGSSDEDPSFYQPGGVSVTSTTLYVADTNNHAIRAVDLETKETRTLPLEGIEPPTPPARTPRFPNAEVIERDRTPIEPGRGVTLAVALEIPGYKLVPGAPIEYLVESDEELADGGSTLTSKVSPPQETFEVEVPLAQAANDGAELALRFSVSVFACAEEGGFCTVKNYTWNVPLDVQEGAGTRVELSTNPAAAAN